MRRAMPDQKQSRLAKFVITCLALTGAGTAFAGVLPEDRADLLYFEYDGGGMGKGGTGTISVDGRQVAQGRIDRTMPLRFSLDETFERVQATGADVIQEPMDQGYVRDCAFRDPAGNQVRIIERTHA